MLPSMTNLESAVEALMLEKGIRTREELAERAGLHINTVRNVLRGTVRPHISLPAIAKALGVRPSEILRRAEAEALRSGSQG